MKIMSTKYLISHSWISLILCLPFCCPWEVEIIKPRSLAEGYKAEAEAELSFFTHSLGFVDDEYQQYLTPTHNFLQKYARLTKWREAIDTRMTRDYVETHGVSLCTAYLSDPIFKAHHISFYISNPDNSFTTELKLVEFHYSSRQTALVKVVKCPIQRTNPVTNLWEESKLYFHEIHHSQPNDNRLQRGYFVFVNIKGLWKHDEPLEFLMYTSCNKTPLPNMMEQGEEVKFRMRSKEPAIEGFTIKFNVIEQPNNGVRLFREEAEIIFLTKEYGFVDHELPLWKKKTFIQIIDRLKKDYDVNESKLEDVEQSNAPMTCQNYIEHNDQLRQYNIHIREVLIPTEISWTLKLVHFPKTQILQNGRNYELLQCPVILNENAIKGYLYILPVHYMKISKAALVFTFKDSRKNINTVVPFILSPVNENNFPESTSILQTVRGKEKKDTESISNSSEGGISSIESLSELDFTALASESERIDVSDGLLKNQHGLNLQESEENNPEDGFPKTWKRFN